MKRLVFIISSLDAGGAERVLSGLANHQVLQGHKVTIITASAKESFYEIDSAIHLIQLKKTDKFLAVLPRILGVFYIPFLIRRTIKSIKPDVIISFMDLMNMLVLFSCWGLNIPVLISERIDPRFRPLPGILKWLRLKLYPLAQALVVQTKTVADYFPKTFQKFIHIIPNAVVKSEATLATYNEQGYRLVSIGRLDPQKDHKTLVSAMALLVQKFPELRLTIYGKGPEKDNLEQLIRRLSLSSHVQFAGVTSDVPGALSQADIFVFPSLYEGFPNALCEAMAMGLPVVASDCSGNVDVIQDGVNGLLFKAGDTESLAARIVELIHNQDRRCQLGAEALKLTEIHSPEKIFKAWDQLISTS